MTVCQVVSLQKWHDMTFCQYTTVSTCILFCQIVIYQAFSCFIVLSEICPENDQSLGAKNPKMCPKHLTIKI